MKLSRAFHLDLDSASDVSYGRTLKEMADITSKAAIVAATPSGAAGIGGNNNGGGGGNNNNNSGSNTPQQQRQQHQQHHGSIGSGFNSLPTSIHLGLSEKLHGLSEKLQSLGKGGGGGGGVGGGEHDGPRSRTSKNR